MMPLRLLVSRKACKQVNRRLDLNIRARLKESRLWLTSLSALHVLAMDEALRLALTTLTSEGYSGLSAVTPLASIYIDDRLLRKEHVTKSRWRWQIHDHNPHHQ